MANRDTPRLTRARLAWGAGSDEEARAYLQERLAVFSKALFWSFVALVVFLFAMYSTYPTIQPHNQRLIYGTATLALAILAFLWRYLLLRGKRSMETLYRIDLLITIGSGVTFGIVAPLAYELQAAAYTCLLYESFVVFTRALLVPSSERRTLVVSSLAFVPILIGTIVLAVLTEMKISTLEIPGPAFIAGDVLYNAVAVLLATTGSRIIYTLRGQVSEAKQLGQYTLEAKIGEGGMGTVYRAKHGLLRRETAIKVVQREKAGTDALVRFEQEVQLLSQLTHPNTVAVFDYGRSLNGEVYYAMELLDGVDLQRLVQLDGLQAPGRVVKILSQVCGALQEAHERGLIHRDIKPANIILCERGGAPDVAKVVDFGLVQEIKGAVPDVSKQVLGTPAYLAPENITDPSTVGPAVDLYALGAVGYFLLTGQLVFTGKTNGEIALKHVTDKPRPPSELAKSKIPELLEGVILKCLEKQPGDRYASATALAEALEAVSTADWDRECARTWWTAYRKRQAATPRTDTATVTLQIDVGDRVTPS